MRLEPKYMPMGWMIGMYLVEWRTAFVEVCFGAFDIIGHDIGDSYARVWLVPFASPYWAVSEVVPLMASSTVLH